MRTYSSTAVKELLRAHPESSDPEAIIRSKAVEIVEMYMALCDDPFPIDMKMLASCAGVRVKTEILLDGASGQLIPTPEGPIAIVNSIESQARQNFTIGHEIGHTFFPNYLRKKFRLEHIDALQRNVDDEEEYLCDVAASELLIPTNYFLEYLAGLPFSVPTLMTLADKFGASLEAVALKMIQTASIPCALLVCEKILKPSEEKQFARRRRQSFLLPEFETLRPTPKLRIKYAVRSSSWCSGYIPRFASIPEESSIMQSAKDCEVRVEHPEVLSIKDFGGVFHVETLPLDYVDDEGHSTKTFTLLLPKDSY